MDADAVAPNGTGGALVAKYDPAGAFQWANSATGPPASPVPSIAAKCAVDVAGNSYLAGWYQTTTSFGTNVLHPEGTWNYFLAKLATGASASTYAPVSIAGDTMVITITNSDNATVYALVTNLFSVSTFDQFGPDSNNTYSGNYFYTKTGTNTGMIYTVKTSPPPVAGETGTNVLTFASPMNGSVVHTWPKGGGSYGVQIGAFQIITTVLTTAPTITTEHSSLTTEAGTTATFTISASGTAPLAYRWRFNGTNLHSSISSL